MELDNSIEPSSDVASLVTYTSLVEYTYYPVYKCLTCYISYLNFKEWEYHYYHYHLGLRYMCTMCEFRYSVLTDLLSHMKTAHSVICYYCYICRTLQYTYKAYTEHVLNVHAPYNINGLYMCFKCIPWRSIDSMTELLNHCRSNHMPTIHICYLCDNKYYFENAFLEHKLTHWQYKERKCEICNEQFSSLNLLTQHIRKSHHDAILCEKCYDARIYQSKTMLKVHDHAEHTDIVIL